MAKSLSHPHPYTPPQQRLGPCASCGCTVFSSVFVAGTAPLCLGTTPVLHAPHDCQQALRRWQVLQGWLDGRGVLTHVTLPDGQVDWMLMELAEGVRLEELGGQELTVTVKEHVT